MKIFANIETQANRYSNLNRLWHEKMKWIKDFKGVLVDIGGLADTTFEEYIEGSFQSAFPWTYEQQQAGFHFFFLAKDKQSLTDFMSALDDFQDGMDSVEWSQKWATYLGGYPFNSNMFVKEWNTSCKEAVTAYESDTGDKVSDPTENYATKY